MVTVVGFDFVRKSERLLDAGESPVLSGDGWFYWIDAEDERPENIADVLRHAGFNPETVLPLLSPGDAAPCAAPTSALHWVFYEITAAPTGLRRSRLDVLLNARALVTFHASGLDTIRRVRQTYREDFIKFSQSSGFLIYEIVDHLITGYRQTLLHLAEAVQGIHKALWAEETHDDIFPRVSGLNQSLLAFRQTLMATREILHQVTTRQSPFVAPTTIPSLERLAGTLDRLSADATTERDALAEALNLYMGMVSHRTNRVLKRLTVISVIFLPLTFLCGVYGMNFEHIPELHWKYAYGVFWVVVVVIVAVLLVLMRRSRWL